MTGVSVVKGGGRDTNRVEACVEVETGIGVMGKVAILYQHPRGRCETVSSPEPRELTLLTS